MLVQLHLEHLIRLDSHLHLLVLQVVTVLTVILVLHLVLSLYVLQDEVYGGAQVFILGETIILFVEIVIILSFISHKSSELGPLHQHLLHQLLECYHCFIFSHTVHFLDIINQFV